MANREAVVVLILKMYVEKKKGEILKTDQRIMKYGEEWRRLFLDELPQAKSSYSTVSGLLTCKQLPQFQLMAAKLNGLRDFNCK